MSVWGAAPECWSKYTKKGVTNAYVGYMVNRSTSKISVIYKKKPFVLLPGNYPGASRT